MFEDVLLAIACVLLAFCWGELVRIRRMLAKKTQ